MERTGGTGQNEGEGRPLDRHRPVAPRHFIEVWGDDSVEIVPIDTTPFTIGRAASCDVDIADPEVSRLHLVLSDYSEHWVVRELGSTNGTLLNGRQLAPGEHAIRHGDEVRIGSYRLVLRLDSLGGHEPTTPRGRVPDLTARERDVVLALCRPLTAGTTFAEPASVRRMAEELSVSGAAVKQHLLRLYDKFEIEGDTRRAQLANEVLRRRVVDHETIRASTPPTVGC